MSGLGKCRGLKDRTPACKACDLFVEEGWGEGVGGIYIFIEGTLVYACGLPSGFKESECIL